jgi:2-keto-4-pentenoate hydratase
MDVTVQELAARQIADYRNLSPGTYFGDLHEPLSLDEAYRVQAEVSRLRVQHGDKVTGYKLGCTSPEIERRLGLRGPIHAVLFESELRHSGALLDTSSFVNLAIEGEMAARIGENGKIIAVFPVIELHNLIFRGEPKTLTELIVNNGLNAGVVLPDKRASAEALEHFATPSLSVRVNGECIDEGLLWSLPGGLDASLQWLEMNLARHGGRLLPGHLVLTGTPLGIHRVYTGDHVEVFAGADYVHCFIQ